MNFFLQKRTLKRQIRNAAKGAIPSGAIDSDLLSDGSLDQGIFKYLNQKITNEISDTGQRRELRRYLSEMFRARQRFKINKESENPFFSAEFSIEITNVSKKEPRNHACLYSILPVADAYEIELNLEELYYSVFIPAAKGCHRQARNIHTRQTFYAVMSFWCAQLSSAAVSLLVFLQFPKLARLLKNLYLQ